MKANWMRQTSLAALALVLVLTGCESASESGLLLEPKHETEQVRRWVTHRDAEHLGAPGHEAQALPLNSEVDDDLAEAHPADPGARRDPVGPEAEAKR